ncbi:MAG: hypothetical protein AAF357_17945, partial [Verrucomicrobiota bacterium]
MRHALLRFSILFLVLATALAGASEVEELTSKFEAAKERALNPFQEKRVELDLAYFDQLEALSKRLQTNGNLEGIVEVRNERELMTKTGEIGKGESANLQPLRDRYLANAATLTQQIRSKENELNGIYVNELQRLQKKLTMAGKIDEAQKAKAIVDSLDSKRPTGAPASDSNALGKVPWFVPDVTPEVLEGGTFIKPVVFPSGRHRLRERVKIGERDPVKPGKVYFSENTEISCTGNGKIYIIAGRGHAYKTVFTTAIIEGGLVGDWEFVSCVLDRTPLRKGDTWRGRPHASQWLFDDCKISGDFFDDWSTKEVGYQIRNTTFERIDFLDLEYHDAADKVAQKEWL